MWFWECFQKGQFRFKHVRIKWDHLYSFSGFPSFLNSQHNTTLQQRTSWKRKHELKNLPGTECHWRRSHLKFLEILETEGHGALTSKVENPQSELLDSKRTFKSWFLQNSAVIQLQTEWRTTRYAHGKTLQVSVLVRQSRQGYNFPSLMHQGHLL